LHNDSRSIEQHEGGKQHGQQKLSWFLYGEGGHAVPAVIWGEGLSLETDSIEAEVAERAQRAWGLVTKQQILSCSGWELFEVTSLHLQPEALCIAQQKITWPTEGTHLDDFSLGHPLTPAGLLCVAEWLTRIAERAPATSPSITELTLGLEVDPLPSGLGVGGASLDKQMAVAIGLCAVARAFRGDGDSSPASVARLRLQLGHHGKVTPEVTGVAKAAIQASNRRLIRMVVEEWTTTFAGSIGLELLELHTEPGWLLPKELQALRDAARGQWKAVATAFLLGSHARLGASSGLKQMPSVLLLRILGHAKPAFCTAVEVIEGDPEEWNKTRRELLVEPIAATESESDADESSEEGSSDDDGPPVPPGYAGINFGEDLAHIMATCM